MHVVLAEDSAFIRDRYTDYLEQAGHHVTSYIDGRGVLAHFANQSAPVDAVITDMQMPYADGFSVLQAVATNGCVPTLLHSSLGSADIVTSGRTHEVDLTQIASLFPFARFHLKNADMRYMRDFLDSLQH